VASFGDLNSFICIGRLTRDPELRYTPSGKSVCKMGIAVNRSYKSGEEIKEDVLFINVTSWGKQGENCAQYLSKGRRVALNGELRSNNWVDKDGNKRYGFEVSVSTIQFLDGKRNGQDDSYSQGDAMEDSQEGTDEEIPAEDVPS
jgi:single-strand DNA-binding protein